MMSASQPLQSRVSAFQKKVDDSIKSVTTAALPIQQKAFQCCVDCFPPKSLDDPQEEISRCIQKCNKKPEAFTDTLQSEVQMLQNNIQSCQQVCVNRFSPIFSESTNDASRIKIQAEMEHCASKCLDQYEPFVDEISERLHSVIRTHLR
ncbi:YOU2 family C2C2 zinc finger protein [Cardiosporidium cionae]|uniref:YOU2 family C2C2 zinc finger protein n=1 Tax=Cardiosporidium cionae TaxID=476202 RepID=A0ABQ7J9G8_9APIC|nr:YOU2 family C2C2 zinc finger protein [Cardiosporidium cionae]|eukprot:KAF8820642.1 YOU2 family C2C2 zinc finger protein [Cardiosporidium cionae]